MQSKPFDLSVYVITDRTLAGNRPISDIVSAAIKGGATMIQLREKDATDDEMIAIGRLVQPITRETGVPFIVNDRLSVALELEADGLHIGQQDMRAEEARTLIGPHRILGVSTETVEQARQAEAAGADYIGAGDVYGTLSKPDVALVIGLQGLRDIVEAVSLPVVAIGGITLQNAAATIRTGAVGVAVISAVVGAADPEAAARSLYTIVKNERLMRNRKEGNE